MLGLGGDGSDGSGRRNLGRSLDGVGRMHLGDGGTLSAFVRDPLIWDDGMESTNYHNPMRTAIQTENDSFTAVWTLRNFGNDLLQPFLNKLDDFTKSFSPHLMRGVEV
jgi:hypothetical protein